MLQTLRLPLALTLACAMAWLTACTKEPKTEPLGDPAAQKVLVSGTVDLAETAKAQADPLAVLFVIARNERGQIAAVKKMFPPFQYPVSYSLTEIDAMIPGTELSGKLKVTARLDKDGNANPAQPGDVLGRSDREWVELGDKDVRIVLNEPVAP
ncbi:hypothetical protein FBR05_12945 [Deltaproteobacteria bacterium PRO3]|nr:hypothetical protein [Deltaproteobacteria bacterium PRO3]